MITAVKKVLFSYSLSIAKTKYSFRLYHMNMAWSKLVYKYLILNF